MQVSTVAVACVAHSAEYLTALYTVTDLNSRLIRHMSIKNTAVVVGAEYNVVAVACAAGIDTGNHTICAGNKYAVSVAYSVNTCVVAKLPAAFFLVCCCLSGYRPKR